MPGIDAVSVHQPYENEALLYRLFTPAVIPTGAMPAPRLDLLDLPAVAALSQFLAVLFPPAFARRRGHRGEAPYPVHLFADRASIVLESNSAVPAKCTLSRLMDVGTNMNDWLVAWASSADRFPSLDPAWAAYLGLGEADVDAISTGIANRVAGPDGLQITVRNYQGRETVINVPARAKLRLHTRLKRKPAPKFADILATEDFAIGKTAGGQTVLIAGCPADIPRGSEIAVDPRTFLRAVVLVPERVLVRNKRVKPSKEQSTESPGEEE